MFVWIWLCDIMVKSRDEQKFVRFHKNSFSDMITGKAYSFGRTDISLVQTSETFDNSGDMSAIVETTSTIWGDLQFVTVEDQELLASGYVKVGDALFYALSSVSLNEQDEIEVDSVRWVLQKKVEGPQISGTEVHQLWACSRKGV